MNVSDLQMVLGLSYSTNNSTFSENKDTDYNMHGKKKKSQTLNAVVINNGKMFLTVQYV